MNAKERANGVSCPAPVGKHAAERVNVRMMMMMGAKSVYERPRVSMPTPSKMSIYCKFQMSVV